MRTKEEVINLINTAWKPNHEKVFNVIKDIIKTPAIGAEIGVAYGGNSFNLLEKFKNLILYSIDPYKKYSDTDGMSQEVENENGDTLYNIVSSILNENFKERSIFIRDTSDSLSKLPDNFFDFIFIDGDHSYEAVLKDINNSFCKIRKSGILIGDDYGVLEELNFQVRKAVDEFCLMNNCKLNRGDGVCPGNIWWIVK